MPNRPSEVIEAENVQLKKRVRELEQLLTLQLRTDEMTWESGVSAETGEPFLCMRWGDQRIDFSPAQARDHAVGIIEASGAAEHDAALMKILVERVELPHDQAAGFLAMMREKRGGTRQASSVETTPETGG